MPSLKFQQLTDVKILMSFSDSERQATAEFKVTVTRVSNVFQSLKVRSLPLMISVVIRA